MSGAWRGGGQISERTSASGEVCTAQAAGGWSPPSRFVATSATSSFGGIRVPALGASTLIPRLGHGVHPLLWILTLAQEMAKHSHPFLFPTTPGSSLWPNFQQTCPPALGTVTLRAAWWLYECLGAATAGTQPGWLKLQSLINSQSGRWMPEIKASAGWFLLRTLLGV